MIEITKKYWKWSKGDRPTVTRSKEEELIKKGFAKRIGGTVEKEPKETKKEGLNNG